MSAKSSKSRGLGASFADLIPTDVVEAEFDPSAKVDEGVSRTKMIDVSQIAADPDQPRKRFDQDALEQLAESIKLHGVLQPLIVSETSLDRYILIAGERRLRAAKIAKIKRVPALIRSIDDQRKVEIALIENIQREDLNPIEAATSYAKLHQQFNLKMGEVAKRVGKASSTVSNMVRLLELPKEAKDALVDGKISEGHARAVLSVPEGQDRKTLLEAIIGKKLTVREAEQFAIAAKKGQATKTPTKIVKTTENEFTKSLSKKLNTEVKLQPLAKGGRLTIRYKTDEELKSVLDKMGIQ